ncbi:MAG: restriction endonuclease [Desulfuromonas sp.]|nr:restriction endonuclease [Desulfuromonas sp.]
MTKKNYIVRMPLFPIYSEAKALIDIWNGIPRSTVSGMIKAIVEQTGTPQNPVDWTDPDTWIPERLKGDYAKLAAEVWLQSGGTVNPRHTYGSYLFINAYELLTEDHAGLYRLSNKGQGFIDGHKNVIMEIDELEGIPQLLGILAPKTTAKRVDLLDEWSSFLDDNSKFNSASTFKDTLRRRMMNLIDRGFVSREGNIYTITEKGREYASGFSQVVNDPKQEVARVVSEFNNAQRKVLRDQLSIMNPYRFEHLAKELLEAMEYQDVEVTKASGDKGVDVIATAQFGITTVKEVVQVKRHQGNIGRTVLDQLRGVLPLHGAIRGTLITLGKFSKGCKKVAVFPGAAPISLIDGDKLIDLLIENKIGIKEQKEILIQVDEAYFADEEISES